MADKAFTPYSTVAPWLKGQLPGWVPTLDQERVASYGAYNEMYWNHNENYKLVTRGTDDLSPIYVPRARIIVETMNMYVGKDFNFLVDPDVGTPQVQGLAKAAFTRLFTRERVLSRYNANKRFGLVHGDWAWHLMADPTKPPGTRLRLIPIDPSSYFPVYRNDDPDRLEKVHLAERYLAVEDNKWYVKKRTYSKEVDGQGAFTGVILLEEAVYEEEKTFKADGQPTRVIIPPTPLDPRITDIPVFHIPNFEEPGNPFGSSELRGLERLLAGLNQAFSDEDAALALMGIGVYATDSTQAPRNRQGQETEWTVYPGKVLQGAVNFRKVEGITSVTPYGDHIERMKEELGLASGATAAAMGSIDVAVAESGVALALRLSPTTARAEEKDQIILDIMGQLNHNLVVWHMVYEGEDLTTALVVPTLGDKLPRNKSSEVDMVLKLMSADPPVMSAKTAREYLTEHAGLEFAEAEDVLVYAERKRITEMSAPPASDPAGGTGTGDPFLDRINAELTGAPDPGATTDPVGTGAQADAASTTAPIA